MADPLSVAASCAGLKIAAVKTATELRAITKNVTSTSVKEFHALTAQVEALCVTIQALQRNIESVGRLDPSPPAAQLLNLDLVISVLTDAVTTFSDLDAFLSKFKNAKPTSLRRLRSPSSRLDSLSARLDSVKSSLSLILAVITAHSTT
jgi:hypothetical protein